MKKLSLFLVVLACLLVSCKPEVEKPTLPEVVTAKISDIRAYSAVISSEILSDGGFFITAKGVCWSTNPNPTINDSKTNDGSGANSFVSELTQLEPGTTYYVRAYATNEAGTGYGSIYEFFTSGNGIDGYDFVDLGLSVKWAICNIGANNPEDYGDYFAWGETTTKAEYTKDNSDTYGLGSSELKSQGIIDKNGNLTPSYDAASANWGGSWRMPRKSEMQELLYDCTWEWITQNGVNGYEVTGPNGNSIFLPAARDPFLHYGEHGIYWSSTSGNYSVCYLGFNSDDQYVSEHGNCENGFTIRPVSE